MKTYIVNLHWEEDTWCAHCDSEEFGLVLESDSLDVLVERVKVAIQDILEVDYKYTGDVQFIFQAERVDSISARAS